MCLKYLCYDIFALNGLVIDFMMETGSVEIGINQHVLTDNLIIIEPQKHTRIEDDKELRENS